MSSVTPTNIFPSKRAVIFLKNKGASKLSSKYKSLGNFDVLKSDFTCRKSYKS